MAITAAEVFMGALYARGVEVIFGSFLEHARPGMQEWRKFMEAQGTRQDKPMKPQAVAWELGQQLSDSVTVMSDSGTATTRCFT